MVVALIAEVASNAGGNLLRAYEFIDRFAAAGADILKFQLTRAHRLAFADPQREWFFKTEWSDTAVEEIAWRCRDKCVEPMFTVYHPDDVVRIKAFRSVKVGCGEAHSTLLARAVLTCDFQRIYVSEGIRPMADAYRSSPRVIRLGVCPHYPAPRGVVNARFQPGAYDGWSDHSIGLDESMLAVILGATVIERHVQLPTQARPPQPYELTVEEFAELRRRVDANPERFLDRWNHG